jgi:Ca2+-binding EF-hand superfamily protein
MKLTQAVLFSAAALALAAGSAFAADDKRAAADHEPGFNALDKNKDGHVSRAEAASDKDLAKKFKEADRDNDGKLSRSEYLMVKAKKDAGTVKDKVSNAIDKSKENDKQRAATGASTPAAPAPAK